MAIESQRDDLIHEIMNVISFEAIQLAKVSILNGVPPSEREVARVRERVERVCIDTMRVDDPAFGLSKVVVQKLLDGVKRDDPVRTPILTVRQLANTDALTLRTFVGFGSSALAQVRKCLARQRRALRGEEVSAGCSTCACSPDRS